MSTEGKWVYIDVEIFASTFQKVILHTNSETYKAYRKWKETGEGWEDLIDLLEEEIEIDFEIEAVD